jgi:hypothetical protein
MIGERRSGENHKIGNGRRIRLEQLACFNTTLYTENRIAENEVLSL